MYIRLLKSQSILLLFSFVFILNCNKDTLDKSEDTMETNEAQLVSPQSSPYEITLAHGGGFTGMISGYTIYNTGKIDFWQQNAGGEKSIVRSTETDSKQIEAIREELINSGALELSLKTPGNMTNSVTYSTSDSTYTWIWSGTNLEAETIPENFNKWYQSTKKYCDNTDEGNK